jgi:hypothetical protein
LNCPTSTATSSTKVKTTNPVLNFEEGNPFSPDDVELIFLSVQIGEEDKAMVDTLSSMCEFIEKSLLKEELDSELTPEDKEMEVNLGDVQSNDAGVLRERGG